MLLGYLSAELAVAVRPAAVGGHVGRGARGEPAPAHHHVGGDHVKRVGELRDHHGGRCAVKRGQRLSKMIKQNDKISQSNVNQRAPDNSL